MDNKRDQDDGEFGRWLDVTMDNNKVSGRDLARLVGVTDGAVSRWRNGAVTPSVPFVQEIARALGADPLRLLVTAHHIDGELVKARPYRTPEPVQRRAQAIKAFGSIKGLTDKGRLRLLELYDQIIEEESFNHA